MPKEGLSLKQLAAQAALAAGLQQQVAGLSADNEALRRAAQQRDDAGLGDRAGRQLQALASAFAVREEPSVEPGYSTPPSASLRATPAPLNTAALDNIWFTPTTHVAAPRAVEQARGSSGLNSRREPRVSTKVPSSGHAAPSRAAVRPHPRPPAGAHMFADGYSHSGTVRAAPADTRPSRASHEHSMSSARSKAARSTMSARHTTRSTRLSGSPSTATSSHHGVSARRVTTATPRAAGNPHLRDGQSSSTAGSVDRSSPSFYAISPAPGAINSESALPVGYATQFPLGVSIDQAPRHRELSPVSVPEVATPAVYGEMDVDGNLDMLAVGSSLGSSVSRGYSVCKSHPIDFSEDEFVAANDTVYV